jgi:hypothetical protein
MGKSKIEMDWEEWDDFVSWFETEDELAEVEKDRPTHDLDIFEVEAVGSGLLSISAVEGFEAE